MSGNLFKATQLISGRAQTWAQKAGFGVHVPNTVLSHLSGEQLPGFISIQTKEVKEATKITDPEELCVCKVLASLPRAFPQHDLRWVLQGSEFDGCLLEPSDAVTKRPLSAHRVRQRRHNLQKAD